MLFCNPFLCSFHCLLAQLSPDPQFLLIFVSTLSCQKYLVLLYFYELICSNTVLYNFSGSNVASLMNLLLAEYVIIGHVLTFVYLCIFINSTVTVGLLFSYVGITKSFSIYLVILKPNHGIVKWNELAYIQ